VRTPWCRRKASSVDVKPGEVVGFRSATQADGKSVTSLRILGFAREAAGRTSAGPKKHTGWASKSHRSPSRLRTRSVATASVIFKIPLTAGTQ